MDFANPKWLFALWALPLVIGWLALGARRSRAELDTLIGTTMGESLAPGHSWRKNLIKGIFKVAGIGLLIFALAGPRFGSQLVKLEREGIDLVIALDTSLSMLAEDMLPSRLERAKQEIVDLIRGLKGDRVGVVVFAGDAFALCPLTVDYDAALMFTRSVDVDVVSEPGTALRRAIETSVALFEQSGKRDRAIILVTDGENHGKDPVEVAQAAGEEGIRIYTIGIGSPTGELIPERRTDGSIAGYKKDRRGETVLTQLEENTLQRIAVASKGKYLPATREGLELKVLYDEISGMEGKMIKGEFVERRKERFWIFLLAALALLWADLFVGTRGIVRAARRARMLHTGVGMVLVLAVLLAPAVAGAKTVDRNKVKSGNQYFGAGEYDKALTLYGEALGDTLKPPKHFQGVFYNRGNTYFMMNNYQEAIEAYTKSVSEDSSLTAHTLYNRANSMMASGNLKEAVESYVQALQFMPDDPDARHNLEMALRQLEQQQQDQQQQSQDQQGQDQPQDQQQQDQQQQQQDQEEQDEQQQQQDQNQAQPDSTRAQPQPADSSAVPPPQLTPEDMMKLSKEDAMRILQALEEQEKKLQQEKRKAAFRRMKKSGKDW